MPNIDLSILNQRQTPAFYADVFANRPAAGFVGRIFVSTDTYAFYRDNGTGWDLIGGPGTGTVTGTGANGQVTFWNGASTITGSNDLFWDSVNGHLGVNTNVPGTALDVHHDQPTVAILNQTTATNDVRIGFQNNGVGLWRIGAFYNAGANDFGIFDAVGNIQPVTVKKTTGQVLIGTSTVGSGKLVVASATGDNGIQIVGASAPSLRIDSAESGPTKRAGLGISTATNNFIQGSSDRDFCMFNGSTTASPILFGVYDAVAGNVQEAARISATRNFLIGTTTDNSKKLQVNGNMSASAYYVPSSAIGGGFIFDLSGNCGIGIGQSSNILQFYSGGSEKMRLDNSGNLGLNTTNPQFPLEIVNPNTSPIAIVSTRENANGPSYFVGRCIGGTIASPTDQVGQGAIFQSYGYRGGSYREHGYLIFSGVNASSGGGIAGSLNIFLSSDSTINTQIASATATSFNIGGDYTQTTDTFKVTGRTSLTRSSGLTASVTNSVTSGSGLTGYGLLISSEASASSSYALHLIDSTGSVSYGGVSTASGQVGYWSIGFAATGTIGNRLSVSGAMSVGSGSYLTTAAPSNGAMIQGNTLLGTTTDAGQKLQVNGSGLFTGASGARNLTLNSPTDGGTLTFETGGVAYADMGSNKAALGSGSATDFYLGTRAGYKLSLGAGYVAYLTIKSTGIINMSGLPTSSAGLSAGDIWNNGGVLNIV